MGSFITSARKPFVLVIFLLLPVLSVAGDRVLVRGKDFRITEKEVNALISMFPKDVQLALRSDPNKVALFLKHLAEVEVLSRKARRDGLDKDPKVRAFIEWKVKEVLASEWLKREVEKRASRFKLSDEDLELYYKTHRDEFRDSKGRIVPFSKVRDKIKDKLEKEWRKNLVDSIVEDAMNEEEVSIAY